jgi:hypothetical protein
MGGTLLPFLHTVQPSLAQRSGSLFSYSTPPSHSRFVLDSTPDSFRQLPFSVFGGGSRPSLSKNLFNSRLRKVGSLLLALPTTHQIISTIVPNSIRLAQQRLQCLFRLLYPLRPKKATSEMSRWNGRKDLCLGCAEIFATAQIQSRPSWSLRRQRQLSNSTTRLLV